jgi:hypothetical protein
MINFANEEWESGIMVCDNELKNGNLIIHHMAFYKVDDPTDQVELLRKELDEDEEFGLCGKLEDKKFIVVTKKDQDVLRNILCQMI